MELILVRHGLPERVETLDGSPADPPLSADGHEQARRVGAWLLGEGVDRIYTSPLRRALQTAAPLSTSLGIEPALEAGVAEFDREADSYVPLEELKRTDPVAFRALVESGWEAYLDPVAFGETVVTAMERIIAENPGGRAVVFCHGGVINFWASHVLGTPRRMFFHPQYTSINRFLASSAGHRGVASLNEQGHLR